MIPSKIYAIIYDIMPMIILFIIMAILLKVVTVELGKNKGNSWTEFKFLCYIIYSFVLFELVTTTDFTSYSNNFIPFKEIMRYEISSPLFWRNVIGNILIFAPFGYLITDVIWMFSKHRNIFISLAFTISCFSSCSPREFITSK
jgi:glycopeptide antibiotics resistance protein